MTTENKPKLSVADRIIEKFGDCVIDMFEQMEPGNWVDDHDHAARMTKAMLDLIPVVLAAMNDRATPQPVIAPWVMLTDEDILEVIEASKNVNGRLMLPFSFSAEIQAAFIAKQEARS